MSSRASPRAVFSSAQQLQDLGLDRDIERRRRLIGDQQGRIVGERHRDHHPLPLAARELVRKSIEAARGIGEAGLAQHLDHPCAQGRPAKALMQADRLRHLPPDAVQRVEARHRLLEHDPGHAAAGAAQDAGIRADHVPAIEHDPAGRIGPAWRQQLQ